MKVLLTAPALLSIAAAPRAMTMAKRNGPGSRRFKTIHRRNRWREMGHGKMPANHFPTEIGLTELESRCNPAYVGAKKTTERKNL
jgi:hypothetical protein